MVYNKTIQSQDGTNLNVKVSTHIDKNKAKANVIIAHGLAEHLGRYDELVVHLLENFNVVRYDQRGHGHSEGKKAFYSNEDEIVEDLQAVVDFTKDNLPDLPIYAIGHSMGGYTVALYGSKFPGDVDGFVTSGALTRNHLNLMADLPEEMDDEEYVPNELSDGLCATPQVVEEYAADDLNLKEISAGLGRTLQKGVKYLKENAESFKDPVLILHGKEDGLVSDKDSTDFYTEIGSEDKSLVIYSGLQHEIFNEASKKHEIYDTVSQWLLEQIEN